MKEGSFILEVALRIDDNGENDLVISLELKIAKNYLLFTNWMKKFKIIINLDELNN